MKWIACCCIFSRLPLLAVSFSSTNTKSIRTASTTTTTASKQNSWQDDLLQISQPLTPTPISDALSTLQRDGVVRLDASSARVDPDLCAHLRQCILDEISPQVGDATNSQDDKKYVPGTRLRFQCPMDLAFGGDVRHDLLLPIENAVDFGELRPVLESAVSQLQPVLTASADLLLPRLHGGNINNDQNEPSLEVVEVASLIVRCGSGHQQLHGDYRRFPCDDNNHDGDAVANSQEEEPESHTLARIGKMPPRLVTFVALQDVPSIQHGATGFVTGTHNAKAHGQVYGEDPSDSDYAVNINDQMDEQDVANTLVARRRVLELSTSGVRTTAGFRAGEMLVYDASVLHWGSANQVEGNNRAMLYFGVARPGAAELLSQGQVMSGYEALPPVLLDDIVGKKCLL